MNIELNVDKANALCRWTLDEAVTLVREIEPQLKDYGLHCGITGGVLFNGCSLKDVDLIIYPNKSTTTNYEALVDATKHALDLLGIKIVEKRNHCGYGDNKIVYMCTYNNRRVDVFIMQ